MSEHISVYISYGNAKTGGGREFGNKSLEEIAANALWKAINDDGLNGVDALVVGGVHWERLTGTKPEQLARIVRGLLDGKGLGRIKVIPYLNHGLIYEQSSLEASAYGGRLFQEGVNYIIKGEHQKVAIFSLEQTNLNPGFRNANPNLSEVELNKRFDEIKNDSLRSVIPCLDKDYKLTMAGIADLLRKLAISQCSGVKEVLDEFIIGSRRNASGHGIGMPKDDLMHLNRYAGESIDDYLKEKQITGSYTMPMLCPISSGWSFVTIQNEMPDQNVVVQVAGTGQGISSPLVFSRQNPLSGEASVEAFKQAFKMAQIRRKDVKLKEFHNAFDIILLSEMIDSGFFKSMEEVAACYKDPELRSYFQSFIPLSGGPFCGHPVGPTTLKSIAEMYLQLTNKGRYEGLNKEYPVFGAVSGVGGPKTYDNAFIFYAFEKEDKKRYRVFKLDVLDPLIKEDFYKKYKSGSSYPGGKGAVITQTEMFFPWYNNVGAVELNGKDRLERSLVLFDKGGKVEVGKKGEVITIGDGMGNNPNTILFDE